MQFQSSSYNLEKSLVRSLHADGSDIAIHFRRNVRARRYILRVTGSASARVTLPRRGTISEAWDFVLRHQPWIQQQIAEKSRRHQPWQPGHQIYFRGTLTPLHLQPDPLAIHFADQILPLSTVSHDLRPAVERHLWKLAARELPLRTRELAIQFQFHPRSISVRNQRTRWGSCSARGVLSLNWRLVQTPDFVRDYIICHELVHLMHLNHSTRFWEKVAAIFPIYQTAENWLKTHDRVLR